MPDAGKEEGYAGAAAGGDAGTGVEGFESEDAGALLLFGVVKFIGALGNDDDVGVVQAALEVTQAAGGKERIAGDGAGIIGQDYAKVGLEAPVLVGVIEDDGLGTGEIRVGAMLECLRFLRVCEDGAAFQAVLVNGDRNLGETTLEKQGLVAAEISGGSGEDLLEALAAALVAS